MPLNENIGGKLHQIIKYEYKESKYLMVQQARYVYKKVESVNLIYINALKQMREKDQELSKLGDTSRDIKPHRELIANNAEKIDTVLL